MVERLDLPRQVSKAEIEKYITDAQMALVEAYEFTELAYSELTDLQLAIAELYELISGGM